jgi:predicted metal-dependent enzyme (double-stranded beta helix superfamily)
MFDIDDLVAECERARRDPEPRLAIRDVLRTVLAAPGEIAHRLAPSEGGLELLHVSDELTVLHIVWAPGMVLFPHDHRMWAVIGIYGGQEDNTFFRRPTPDDRGIVETGGSSVVEGDVLVLGDDVIHSVANPTAQLTAAIHVYGGDFLRQPRSQWGPGPRTERPYDVDEVNRQFAEANVAWRETTGAGPT